MAAALVNVVVDDKKVQRALSKLEVVLSGPSLAAWLSGGAEPYLRQRAASRFATQGDDATGRWAPLAEKTREIRRAGGFGPTGPINVRTTELKDFILNAPGNTMVLPKGASLSFPGPKPTGELRKKVVTAQRGKPATRGQRKTVPRPVLALGAQDYAYMVGALGMYVNQGMRL